MTTLGNIFLIVDMAQLIRQGAGGDYLGYWPPQWNENYPSQIKIYDTVDDKVYYVDGALRINHTSRMTKTRHPIQNGAPISDHAYREPSRVVIEAVFSDVLQDFNKDSKARLYTDDSTKSISAYGAFIFLQRSKHPITLTTKLAEYTGMLIEDIETPDDISTKYGLRMRVTFEEVLTALVSIGSATSAAPNITKKTPRGIVQSNSLTKQITNTVKNRLLSKYTVTGVGSLLGRVTNPIDILVGSII